MKKVEKMNLGDLLKKSRKNKRLTLREVENTSDISNAYLSQLESNKIKKPSPNVLNTLGKLYELSYSQLMKLAGYPVPEIGEPSPLQSRIGITTREEDDALAEYLEFLRSKRK